MQQKVLTLFFLVALIPLHFVTAQTVPRAAHKTPHAKWVAKNPFEQKVFIENKGQFELPGNMAAKNILFGAKQGGLQYYFTSTGILISKTISVKRSEQEIEQLEKKRAGKEDGDKDDDDDDSWKYKNIEQFHEMTFLDANAQSTITADNEVNWYYNYPAKGNVTLHAHAWKKIIYTDLYPGIDMQVYFPEDNTALLNDSSAGHKFEYSFIVHPGADVSQIRIKYNGDTRLNTDGTITIKSPYGNFIEYAPSTKLLSSNKVVECSFSTSNNEIKFKAESYDKTETLLIDPLVITPPAYNGTNAVYDVDWDESGNIYAYGGNYPWQLLKYNDKGTLLWSYTTLIRNNEYIGDFAVDRHSQSVYITEGVDDPGAQVIKLNKSGTLLATYAGNGNFNEMWKIAFSTCSNQAVIAGGGNTTPSYTASYLDTNLTNLKLVNTLNDQISGYHDMWSLAIDDFGNAYMITAHSHSTIDPNAFNNMLLKLPLPTLAPTTWMVSSHYNYLEIASMTYGYNYTNSAPSNGYNGMAISDTTLYTYDSYIIKKWGTHSGKLLDSIFVNGASKDNSSISWGGITVDDCGNVFVGSHDTVKQYDYNLNFVQYFVEPGTVYDVKLSLSDTLYASGIGFITDTAITLPPCHIIQAVNNIKNVTCDSLGSATISNISGGTAPYATVWNTNPVVIGDTAINLKKGTYIATITDSSCPQQIYKDTIKILGPLRLKLSTNTDTICSGFPVTITVSNGSNYKWSPSTGLSATTGSSIVASPVSTITYTVIGTVTSGGCLDTETVVLNVHPLPTVTIKPTQPAICFGQSVILTGSGATSYSWNPSSSLSSDTLSTVTASPTATTTYTLIGISSFGCVDSQNVVLTVNPIPVVTVSSTSATICAGKSTNLIANGATTYQWSPSTGLNETSGSTITANPSVNTTYTTIGTSLGCSDTTTVAIRVVQDSLKVSTNNTAVCQGNSVIITATGAGNYAWSPTSGLNTTAGSSVTATPASTTTYTLTAVGAAGCPDTEKIVVTVNLPPVLTILPVNPKVCLGKSITLSVNGASTYTWSPSTGLNQTNASSVIANPTATITYTAYGTDALGCNDSTKTIIKVNPLPVVTAVTSIDTICHGLSVTLTASGASTYQWSPTTGLNSATNAIVTAGPTVTTTYSVYGTDTAGCVDTAMVTVNIIPNSLIVTLNPSNSIICLGNSANLTASGGNNYSWYPSTALSATTGSTVTANPTINTTYSVIGVGIGNCADTTFAPITVSPPPTIIVKPLSPEICDGQALLLTASGASTYVWKPSTGLYQTSGSSVDAHPTDTTSYTVIGTDALGCKDSTKFTLDVDDAPVGAFTTSVPSLCYPLQIQFINTTKGGIAYTWDFGDGGTSADENPLHVFLKPSIYKITLIATSANGCSDTVSAFDTLSDYNAGVFVPNSFTPSVPGVNQVFKPNVECTASTGYIFRVYDRWGMMMFESSNPAEGWDGTYKGKAEPLDVYVYYVEMTCGTCNFFKKGDVTLVR